MDKTAQYIKKGNPLRSDLSWWVVILIGAIALAIGIYTLTAEENARRNFVFVVGIFLVFNGLSYAVAGIKRRQDPGPLAPYLLIRSGIGIATGLIVIINRFIDSMSLNQSRLIAGIGLLGIGIVTLVGLVLVRGDERGSIGAGVTALFLSIWGIATLYQAANDNSSSQFIGWMAIIAGLAYCAIGFYRWRATDEVPAAMTHA